MDPSSVPARRSRIRRSRDQWRELLERFEHSGQSREQFCRERGLTLRSFDRWRRQLGKSAAARQVIAGEPLFLELAPDARASSGAWDVELQLGAGVVLRLRRPC